MPPSVAEVAAFGLGDVVMEGGGGGAALGLGGEKAVVSDGEALRGQAGEEQGGEGLLEVVTCAVAGEESGAGVLEFFPVDAIAGDTEDADIDE